MDSSLPSTSSASSSRDVGLSSTPTVPISQSSLPTSSQQPLEFLPVSSVASAAGFPPSSSWTSVSQQALVAPSWSSISPTMSSSVSLLPSVAGLFPSVPAVSWSSPQFVSAELPVQRSDQRLSSPLVTPMVSAALPPSWSFVPGSSTPPDSGFLGLGAGAARVAGSGSKSGARPILGSGASPGSGPVCPGSGPDSGTGTGSCSCSGPGAGSSPGFGLGPNASSHSSCSGSVADLFPAATGPIACPSSATSSSDPHEFVARRWAFHGASRACGVGCPIAGIRGFHSIPADRNCRYDSNFHTGGGASAK